MDTMVGKAIVPRYKGKALSLVVLAAALAITTHEVTGRQIQGTGGALQETLTPERPGGLVHQEVQTVSDSPTVYAATREGLFCQRR